MPHNITYRQLIAAISQKHGANLKIPKGQGISVTDQNGEVITVSLPQSIIYDPNRDQCFAIKPHTSEEKIERSKSLRNKHSLFSYLAPINLDDIVPDKSLPEHLYTQTKKTTVIVSQQQGKPADIKANQEKVARLTTLGFEALTRGKSTFRSDCFERKSTSQHHEQPILKFETITDFLPGDDLVTYLEKYQLTLPSILELSIKMLWAVMLLQNRGIVHGDLKLEHFIIGEDRVLKIIDFESAGETIAGETIAVSGPYTSDYAAPEIINQGRLGFPADNFSMGVVISQVFGLHTPFIERGQALTQIYLQLNELCTQDEENKRSLEYKKLVRELRKEYRELTSQVPQLQYDEALADMCKIFVELNNPALMAKIRPLLHVIVDVVNDLTEPNAENRRDVDAAYFALTNLQPVFVQLIKEEEGPETAPMETEEVSAEKLPEAESTKKDELMASEQGKTLPCIFGTGYEFFSQASAVIPPPVIDSQVKVVQDMATAGSALVGSPSVFANT